MGLQGAMPTTCVPLSPLISGHLEDTRFIIRFEWLDDVPRGAIPAMGLKAQKNPALWFQVTLRTLDL